MRNTSSRRSGFIEAKPSTEGVVHFHALMQNANDANLVLAGLMENQMASTTQATKVFAASLVYGVEQSGLPWAGNL
jgi:hypothetical protein